MRPDVALAFDRMAAAARREAGIYLLITSGYRSDAEQAALWAANPDPKWVARPGTSLHRYATELDLGPPSAYDWLAANSERFGFVRRYSWEPWH
jgi:LAS superfamily LD-carboxypeptidase LdcB